MKSGELIGLPHNGMKKAPMAKTWGLSHSDNFRMDREARMRSPEMMPTVSGLHHLRAVPLGQNGYLQDQSAAMVAGADLRLAVSLFQGDFRQAQPILRISLHPPHGWLAHSPSFQRAGADPGIKPLRPRGGGSGYRIPQRISLRIPLK